jgi:acetate kinase
MKAIVFNCGSSSLKFELIELEKSLRDRKSLARGKFEEIGEHATSLIAWCTAALKSRSHGLPMTK